MSFISGGQCRFWVREVVALSELYTILLLLALHTYLLKESRAKLYINGKLNNLLLLPTLSTWSKKAKPSLSRIYISWFCTEFITGLKMSILTTRCGCLKIETQKKTIIDIFNVKSYSWKLKT